MSQFSFISIGHYLHLKSKGILLREILSHQDRVLKLEGRLLMKELQVACELGAARKRML